MFNSDTFLTYPDTVDSELFPSQTAVALLDTVQNIYTVENGGFTPQPGSGVHINLKVIPEGFYFPLFNQLSRKDTFYVYLRDVDSPFAIRDSSRSVIDSITFSNIFTFSNTPTGSYYIVVKHLNSIETWSKPGGINIFTNQIYEYDFTEARTQAYGNNLQLKSEKYCLYSGDVDQNEFIDLTDLILIFNDSKNFLKGEYLSPDLNGDSIIDLTDISLCYNNLINFIRVRRP